MTNLKKFVVVGLCDDSQQVCTMVVTAENGAAAFLRVAEEACLEGAGGVLLLAAVEVPLETQLQYPCVTVPCEGSACEVATAEQFFLQSQCLNPED